MAVTACSKRPQAAGSWASPTLPVCGLHGSLSSFPLGFGRAFQPTQRATLRSSAGTASGMGHKSESGMLVIGPSMAVVAVGRGSP
jgi:hypothetical protein